MENARRENSAQNCWGGKCGTWKMWHKIAGVENARHGECGTKLQGWKMLEKVCMESHNNVNAAEYIVCSFMPKHNTSQV